MDTAVTIRKIESLENPKDMSSINGIQLLKATLEDVSKSNKANKLQKYLDTVHMHQELSVHDEDVHEEINALRKVLSQLVPYLWNEGYECDNSDRKMSDTSSNLEKYVLSYIENLLRNNKLETDQQTDLMVRLEDIFQAYHRTKSSKQSSHQGCISDFRSLINLDKDMAMEEKLLLGWEKNQHEIKKRYKKFNDFKCISQAELDDIENNIRKCQQENKSFRETVDHASDRISSLIQQLQDANKRSEFLQNQIDIVDETITEMEKFKQNSDHDCSVLERDLQERQNALLELLKSIDQELETNLHKHQDFLEQNISFNEALEELDECYNLFQSTETKILEKYNIIRPEFNPEIDSAVVSNRKNMQLSERVEKLKNEKRRISFQMDDMVTVNQALTADLEDLIEINTQLSLENRELHQQLKKETNESSISDDDKEIEKKSDLEDIEYEERNDLQEKCNKLQKQNEHLRNINMKVEGVFKENEELLNETNNLHDEIDELEERLKKLQDSGEMNLNEINMLRNHVKDLDNENSDLKENFVKLKGTKQPRLIHVKTHNLHLLKLDAADENNDKETESFLEKALVDERDRTVTLETEVKRLEVLNSNLLSVCRKSGLDNFEIGVSYKVSIQHGDGQQMLTYAGVSISEKELSALQNRTKKLEEAYQFDQSKEEENLVEELTEMLQSSYHKCDQMKAKQRQLNENIDYLKQKIESIDQSGDGKQTDNDVQTDVNNYNVLCSVFRDLGINALADGVLYIVHFQAVDDTVAITNAPALSQHSSKPLSFDNAKHIINDNFSMNLPSSFDSDNKIDLSYNSFSGNALDVSLHNILTMFDKTPTEMQEMKVETKRKDEFERLLRITRREADDLKSKNKRLRKELDHLKNSKKEFNKENQLEDIDMEGTGENIDQTEDKNEKLLELEEAYRLSEANCSFLERKYREVEIQLKCIEALIDQDRNDSFDKSEKIECLNQELQDLSKKFKNSNRVIGDLKKDVEYLEREVDYYKERFHEHGIEINESDHRQSVEERFKNDPEQELKLLKADYEIISIDKQRLLKESESLNGRIKFLQTEKKYLQDEMKGLESKHKEHKKVENTSSSKKEIIIDENRERSSSYLEKEVKEHGLAKKFKKLQKENSELFQDLESVTKDKNKIKKELELLSIEMEALKSINDELHGRIINLENTASTSDKSRKRKDSMAIQDFKTHFAVIEEENHISADVSNAVEVIKEEAIFLAHENEEIKESNEKLLQRNFNLRKESLAVGASLKQIDMLKEKISSLENENEILKVESMKGSGKKGRRQELQRKISHECNIPFDVKAIRKSSCVLECKSTQTDPLEQQLPKRSSIRQNDSDDDDEDDREIEVEELQFVIEDLTKRNTELKSKLYSLEKRLDSLDKDNTNLEDINNRLLERNNELKKQVEENRNALGKDYRSGLSESVATDDANLGMNLFFQTDILNEYERVELEETNKSLLYENKMLKADLVSKQTSQQSIKREFDELNKINKDLEKHCHNIYAMLRKLHGDEFTDALKKDFIPNLNELVQEQNETPNVIVTVTATDENENDKMVSELSELKQKNQELQQRLSTLGEQNAEYKRTIDHMERQLLQKKSTSKSSESHDVSSNDNNETVEELIEVKFLLESNAASNSVLDKHENVSDLEDFESCIHDGELTSEMEDFFKNYVPGSNMTKEGNETDMSDSENEDDKEKMADLVVSEVLSEPAVRLSDVRRFRAKEHVEKALDVCQQQLIDYKERNTELYKEISILRKRQQELFNDYEHLKKQNNLFEQKIASSQALHSTKDASMDKLQMEYEHLKSLLEEENAELEVSKETIAVLQGDAENLKKRLQICEEDRDLKSTELQEVSNILTEQNHVFEKRETHCQKLQQMLDLSETEIKDLRKELDSVKQEGEEKDCKLSELEKSFDSTIEQLSLQTSTHEELRQLNGELSKQTKVKDAIIKELQIDISNEKEKCHSLQHQIETLNSKENEELSVDTDEKQVQQTSFHEISEYQDEKAFLETNSNVSSESVIDLSNKDTSTDESKQATEMSLEDGDITLPEIHVSKDSMTDIYNRNFKRSQSFPMGRSTNLAIFNYPRINNNGLSDVSDVESTLGDSDEVLNEDYVHKLKMKLKLSREKIREKNKIIRNQNEDIDNFLEDLRQKEDAITKLSLKLNPQQQNEDGIAEMETPSFNAISSQLIVETTSSQTDVIKELIQLAEECCLEIDQLRCYIKELESISKDSYIEKLHEKLDKANAKITGLKGKIQTCIELNLISCSESLVELSSRNDTISPSPFNLEEEIIVEAPGKTVNEIRNDNEMLKRHNHELLLKLQKKENEYEQELILKETYCNENHIQCQEIERLEKLLKTLQAEMDELQVRHDRKVENLTNSYEDEKKEALAKKEKELLLHQENAKTEILNEMKDDVSYTVPDSIKNEAQYMHLLTRIDEMQQKLKTAEFQIEKDWTIIEDQGSQLENLHQQFIEQRDENRFHKNGLLEAQSEINRLQMVREEENKYVTKIEALRAELNEIKLVSKNKEKELEKILLEKEDGIEKLQEMISQLEKSLNNSQFHIDEILTESKETKDREKKMSERLALQENLNQKLNEELKTKKNFNADDGYSKQFLIEERIIFLRDYMEGLTTHHKSLKHEFKHFQDTFQLHFANYLNQLKEYINTERSTRPGFNEKIQIKEIVNGNVKGNVSEEHQELVDMVKEQENLIKTLTTQLHQAQTIIETKDSVNKLQMDTIIQSLAKRSNIVPRNGKILKPTVELSKAASRMGSSEFLKKCLNQMEKDTFHKFDTVGQAKNKD